MAVGEEKLTDDEIREFIEKKVHHFKLELSKKSGKNGSVLLNSTVACDPATFTLYKDVWRQTVSCGVNKPWTTAAGQTLEKDSTANVVLTQRSREHSHTPSSEKHSTDYKRRALEATSTCTKNKEMSCFSSRGPEVTEKYPSSTGGYACPQEKYKPLRLNTENNLDDGVPGLCSSKHMTQKEKGAKDLKSKEPSGLDSFRGVADVSKDLGTQKLNANLDANANKLRNTEVYKHRHIAYEDKAVTHSIVHSSVDKNLICDAVHRQTSMREDTVDVHSQADLRRTLHDNKGTGFTPLPESVRGGITSETVIKDVQYEDISDSEDMSHVDQKLDTELAESGISSHFENIQYEDVSEDENPQIQNMAVEMPSFSPKVAKPNIKQYGLVQTNISEEELIPEKQVPKKSKAPDIVQHLSCPPSFKTNDCESGRPLGWQTDNSYHPSSGSEDADETDDDMDDDYLVVGLSILDIKLEPVHGDQAHPEKLLLGGAEHADRSRHSGTSPTLSGLSLPPPDPMPASSFSQIEVFDTVERFQKAKHIHFGAIKMTSPGMSTAKRNPTAPQNWSDSSSEPDDSCDTEDSCDYSPGYKHNYLTVPRQLLKNLSAPASSMTESEGEAVSNLQKSPTWSTHDTSKEEYIIISDSDSDNESDQKSESVHSYCGNFDSRIPPTEEFNDGINSYSDHPHSPEKCTPLLEHRARCGNAEVKISEHKISDVVVLSSDMEDDSTQTDEKTSTFSSGAPCVQQKRKTMNGTKKKPHEPRLSSGVSSKAQHECELEMQNSSLGLDGPDHARQENSRQMTSERSVGKKHVKWKRRILSSDSEDPLTDHENSLYFSRKPQTNSLLEDSTTPIRKKLKATPHPSRDKVEKVVSKLKPASGTTPLPKVKQSTAQPISKGCSSELQRSLSYPATQHPYTPTKSPSPSTSKLSSARKQVNNEWEKGYFPTRRDRKPNLGMEEDVRSRNSLDLQREARPRPSNFDRVRRRRHASFESETPLMKRTKSEAIEWTNAIKRKTSIEQRYPVGDSYKWKEERAKKGFISKGRTYRYHRRHHQ
ncbi:uncharacterized protein LOC125000271 [Mugil cephalus]|uniref:uncharacterized protein LOC125000271 n=1 Tax=Mugil cephalus TaxID=48193 RepID=UPI001FB71284|nr:uncharacterized protein LOC125000271 [Mugil cephalus]